MDSKGSVTNSGNPQHLGRHPEPPQCTPKGEEKAVVFKSLRGSSHREEKQRRSCYFQMGNQVVLDKEPDWDHGDNGKGKRRLRLTYYKDIVLKGIQAAGKNLSTGIR